MTKDEALAAAERVLSLVNSQPRTPTKEQVAEAIGYTPSYAEAYATCLQWRYADFSANAPSHLNGPSALNASGMNGPFQGLSRLKPSELIQSEEF